MSREEARKFLERNAITLTQEQIFELKDLVIKIAGYMHGIHDSIEGDEGEPEAWNKTMENLFEIEQILKLDQVTSLYHCHSCGGDFHANPLHAPDCCLLCGEKKRKIEGE